jgi:hypothetical protein
VGGVLMFDATQSMIFDDDRDVIVEEQPEEQPVQVKIHGEAEWHRAAVGGADTACGRSLFADPERRFSRVARQRHESYRGPLCRDCFTSFELHRSLDVTQGDD